MLAKDHIGEKYSRLTIIGVYDSRRFLCQCDCGTIKPVFKSNLTTGKTHSCGCLASETTASRNYKHGYTGTRLYQVWNNMLRRCRDPHNKRWDIYGGRGISVCNEWKGENGFVNFREWAIASGYDENAKYFDCTLDRIDTNGDYEPSNCRWISMREQCKNRRSNVRITYHGITKIASEWSEFFGVSSDFFNQRLRKGWDAVKAIEKPCRGKEDLWHQRIAELRLLTQ